MNFTAVKQGTPNRGFLSRSGLQKPKPPFKAQGGVGLPKPSLRAGSGKVRQGQLPGQPAGTRTGLPGQPPVRMADDSIYQNKINALRTGLNDTNLALDRQQYGVREQFGFDPEFASNPYTQANMLARRAQQRFAGTTDSVAARGQLYSGNVNRLRQADEFTSGAEMDATRRDYLGSLSEIEQKRLAAQRELEGGSADAYEDLIARMQDRELEPDLFSEAAPGKKPGKKAGKPPVKKPVLDKGYHKPTKVSPKDYLKKVKKK